MANASTLESLNIEITANASSATGSVNNLTGSLRVLSTALAPVIKSLQEANRAFKELASYRNLKIPQPGQAISNGAKTATKQATEQANAIREPYREHMTQAEQDAWRRRADAQWNETMREAKAMRDRRLAEMQPTLPRGVINPNDPIAGGTFNSKQFRLSQIENDLRRFNHPDDPIYKSQLAQYEKLAGHPFDTSSIQRAAEAASNAAPAIQQAGQAIQETAQNSQNATPSISQAGQAIQEAGQNGQTAAPAINEAGEAVNRAGQAAQEATPATRNINDALRDAGTNGHNAGNGLRDTARGVREAGEEARRATPRVGGLLNQIGRMMRTMILRTAIRNLIKSFGAAWNAAYQFSHNMGGGFAKSVDQARTILANVAMTAVQTFAPVFQALVPILYVVAEAFQYVCQMIQQLFSLLGMTSDLFGVSMEKMGKFYDTSSSKSGQSAKKTKEAAKETKNLLASWDELNIIQSASNSNPASTGGGGGGGGYKPGSLKDLVKSEMTDVLSVIVGEGMLALGLILACTGHIPLGIGMMVIGAAAIAKPLAAKWGTLSDGVKKTIAEILVIATAAFLAIGLILICTGQIGLGIGMLLLGAANWALTMKIAWGDEVDSGVRKTIAKVMVIAGASMLALGLILACCGLVPLGISLMLAGAAMWYTGMSIDREAVIELVNGVMTEIANWFVQKWEEIKRAAALAWQMISMWWQENVASKFETAWNVVSTYFATLFGDAGTPGSIANVASTAWQAVVSFWETDIAEPVKRAWANVSSFFETLFAGADTPGSIAHWANEAWNVISYWWNGTIAQPVEQGWNAVTQFFMTLFGDSTTPGSIAHWASQAWNAITYWWDGSIAQPIEAGWNAVTGFFKTLFGDSTEVGSIAYRATKAWEVVSGWWADNIGSPIESAWNNVTSFFTGIFGEETEEGSIAYYSRQALNAVGAWWNDSVASPVEGAWESMSDFFETLFGDSTTEGSIAKWASDSLASVGAWWNANVTTHVDSAWEHMYDFFETLFGGEETDGSIAKWANDSLAVVATWWEENVTQNLEQDGIWGGVSGFFKGIFVGSDGNGGIAGWATSAFESVSDWWNTNVRQKLEEDGVWGGVISFFEGIFGTSSESGGISGLFGGMWGDICQLWGDIAGKVETAWGGVKTWFEENVTKPIGNFFIGCVNTIIDALNWFIGKVNGIAFTLPAIPNVTDEIRIGFNIAEIERIPELAGGAYGIPRGDLFIANEAGAELVGSMNGKTTVANQGQIIEGIQRGVADANNEQNRLLQEQNSLLRQILQKSGNMKIDPSLGWSRFNQANDSIYAMTTGR